MKGFKRWCRFQLQMIKLHSILRKEESFQKWLVGYGGDYDFEVIDLIKRRIEDLNNRRLQQGIN